MGEACPEQARQQHSRPGPAGGLSLRAFRNRVHRPVQDQTSSDIIDGTEVIFGTMFGIIALSISGLLIPSGRSEDECLGGQGRQVSAAGFPCPICWHTGLKALQATSNRFVPILAAPAIAGAESDQRIAVVALRTRRYDRECCCRRRRSRQAM